MEHKLFGCKVNKYYLNQRLDYFSNNSPLVEGEVGITIASCEVTDRAKKKYIKEVISHTTQGKKVFLTGCGTITKGQKVNEKAFYDRYPELIPHQQYITLLPESPSKNNAPISHPTTNQSLISTRKAIIIQTGCDNFCSFCLTVRKRGSHISRPQKEIIQEINDFHKAGGQEIVLTGINLAARGCSDSTKAHESRFANLLQAIIDQTDIPRIRISSMGPEYLDDRFFQVIQNPRFMNHFHLSIQSFSDPILKAMRRNYDAKHLDKVLTQFHQTFQDGETSLSLGADIITSFPGETQEEFQITFDALSKYGITKLHAFPFSSHQKGETVPASFLEDQVDPETKKHRNQLLIAEGDNVRQTFIDKETGKTLPVLIEQNKD